MASSNTLSEASPKGTTLLAAYATASAYWDSLGTSSRMMSIRAAQCIDVVGWNREVSSLGPSAATLILYSLSNKKLARASVASYYAAFKRMCELSGVSTKSWPKAPKPPRKQRNVASLGLDTRRVDEAIRKLDLRKAHDTANLLRVLKGSGMRVDVEALDWTAWSLEGEPGNWVLEVTGKGGHERTIPISDRVAELMGSHAKMVSMKRTPYQSHYWNLRQVDPDLGFHDVRRLYATEAYLRSNKDIRAVQELLGHADVGTTAGYIGVDMVDLRSAAHD